MSENISLSSFQKKLFGDLLTNPDITEIAINKAGEILYEDSKGWKMGNEEQCNAVTQDLCEKFSNSIAGDKSLPFNESNPILGTTLRDGSRIQIVKYPACDYGQFSITIRKPSSSNYKLSSYQEAGFFDHIINNNVNISDSLNLKLSKYLDADNFTFFLDEAVKSGKYNIVIAGGTGSGKTTLMKSLINSINKDERIITIEDVRELFLEKQYNYVNLLYPSEGGHSKLDVTASKLLKSSLRMKPDRILIAELRGGETFDWINIISSGHGGSITSLHAGTVDEVIQRLCLMALMNETGANIPYDSIKKIILNTIDIIIHITNKNGQRIVDAFYFKQYTGSKSYNDF